MLRVGQGLLGRYPFPNGTIPEEDRPFLVVSVTADTIGLLVVSTVQGKERKLLRETNVELKQFNPPFLRRSFVKLDSLTYISVSDADRGHLLQGGACLQQQELESILEKLKRYSRGEVKGGN